MIDYKLNKETFNKSYNLNSVRVCKNIWTDDYAKIMSSLINQFNIEYKWDGMFTIDDVIKRIYNDEILFILFVSETPIGYIWFKEINNSTCAMYNLYISKVNNRPNFSSVWFINNVCSNMIDKYDIIDTGCEDWHITMQNTFSSNGFDKL